MNYSIYEVKTSTQSVTLKTVKWTWILVQHAGSTHYKYRCMCILALAL